MIAEPPKSRRFLSSLLVTLIVLWSVLAVASIVTGRPPRVPDAPGFGIDFLDFLAASRDLLAGLDPYARVRFVTPPLSALLAMPFAGLSDGTAQALFYVVNLALILVAIHVVQRGSAIDRSSRWLLFALPIVAAPSLMLIDRGNVDAVVALLVAVVVAHGDLAVVAGVCLAVAASLKVYPAILLFPALIARRRLLVATTIVVGLALLVAFHDMIPGFLHNQVHRAGWTRIDENVSAFTFLVPVYALFPATEAPLKIGWGLALLAIVVSGVVHDRRIFAAAAPGDRRLLTASYLVFTILYPTLVFHYVGVMILLLVAVAVDDRLELGPSLRRTLFVGVLLVFMPARLLDWVLFGSETRIGISLVMNLLPPLGSLYLLAFFVGLRRSWRGSAATAARPAESPPHA